MLSNQIHLPQTPEVKAKGKTVVMHYLDGTEIIWGDEKSPAEATRVARELEIELRAVNYVKWQVRTFISEMVETLESIHADKELIHSILRDGHAFAFNELDPVTLKALQLDKKPELKRAVIEKLEGHYIV